MEEIGHSPLLKYIVADRNITTMSEPDFKIQVSLDDSNITSTVPEKQKLRDVASGSNFTKVLGDHTVEDASDIVDNPSNIKAKPYVSLKDHIDITGNDETHEKADTVSVAAKEDFVLTPVMTITKEEAVFTKGDLKLQKVSVTEDISSTGVTTTVEQKNVSIIKNGNSDIRTEVFNVQQFRTETKTDERDQSESRKLKTKIPTLRFRQAVDQLKQERKNFEDKKEPETPLPTISRSSIPRLKDGRNPTPIINDSTPKKVETTDSLLRLSDEFDKLYNEIAEDQDSLDNLSISSKIEDPVKLDNTFEEIIHAYEENKIQPINVDKVKQSKIPLLKRKSENEIEVPKQTSPLFKQSISVDLGNMKSAVTTSESYGKIQSVTLNKSPIRTNLISRRISEIKSEQDYTEKNSAVNVATVDESNNNKESCTIRKEVLIKPSKVNDNKEKLTATEKMETDNVAMPIFERTHESFECKIETDKNNAIMYKTKLIEKIEEQNITTQKEEKQTNSVTLTKINVEQLYSDSLKNVSTKKYTENSSNSEVQTEYKKEEDISILRGKVNRIIKRMNSKETEIKHLKRDLVDEAPTEKTVLTKIALFERPKQDDSNPTAISTGTLQTSNYKSADPIEVQHLVFNDRPKIIEEVLKALPARLIEENTYGESDNNLNKTKRTDNDNNSPRNKLDPKNYEHTSHIETINEESHIDSASNKPLEVTIFDTDKNINDNNIKKEAIPYSKTHLINPNAEPQSISTDNGHSFDIQIADPKPKVAVESIKLDVSASPVKSGHNNFENNDLNPTNIQKNYFRLAKIENKITSPVAMYNDENNSLNVNGNRRDIQKIASKTAFVEKGTHWKTEQNVLANPLTSDNTPKAIPNIIEQEDKFDRVRVDNQIKIEEKGMFYKKARKDDGQLRIHSYRNNEVDKEIKSNSLTELDLGIAVKGRVKNLIVRMKSLDRLDVGKKEIIDIKERPRQRSVSEKIALFERKFTPVKLDKNYSPKNDPKEVPAKCGLTEEDYAKMIEDLSSAKTKYGVLTPGKMKYLELRDGGKMPAIGIGTALLDPKLTRYVVQAAIDLGYRTIDTAYIYGNEKEVGEAINEKIQDGTVSRSELFIISKLWSTFHRYDLVQRACRASLDAMGLDYFDLYLIHNPMSFKEGGDPVPKIASVIQFSEHDYLDAWFGVERLVREGLVKRGGVSNFNSHQIDRVVEKGKIKPVMNQVECHPYLSQHRLDDFCQVRNVKLCCFGVLGSKGTPQEHKSALPPAIDDPLVRVMAAGLDVSPAVLLISYQLALDRGVIVKASSAAHLWDNLQAWAVSPSAADVSALHALNRNKRTFTFKGMGDTHRNYPFNIPF